MSCESHLRTDAQNGLFQVTWGRTSQCKPLQHHTGPGASSDLVSYPVTQGSRWLFLWAECKMRQSSLGCGLNSLTWTSLTGHLWKAHAKPTSSRKWILSTPRNLFTTYKVCLDCNFSFSIFIACSQMTHVLWQSLHITIFLFLVCFSWFPYLDYKLCWDKVHFVHFSWIFLSPGTVLSSQVLIVQVVSCTCSWVFVPGLSAPLEI
jgi:hypothetical protein